MIFGEASTDELLEVLAMVEGDETDGAPMTLDDCISTLNEEFPGFWWRGGTCGLSSEVIIAPDHNHAEHGERLLREFPVALEHWNEGIEVELRPGSEDNLIRAFAAAMIRTKLATAGVFPEWDAFLGARPRRSPKPEGLADATPNPTPITPKEP